jgi:hypothetical protein
MRHLVNNYLRQLPKEVSSILLPNSFEFFACALSMGVGGLTRLPGVAHALGCRSSQMLKDHVRRLTVQEHEVDRQVFKAMVSDTSLPLEMRLQVGIWPSSVSVADCPCQRQSLPH